MLKPTEISIVRTYSHLTKPNEKVIVAMIFFETMTGIFFKKFAFVFVFTEYERTLRSRSYSAKANKK